MTLHFPFWFDVRYATSSLQPANCWNLPFNIVNVWRTFGIVCAFWISDLRLNLFLVLVSVFFFYSNWHKRLETKTVVQLSSMVLQKIDPILIKSIPSNFYWFIHLEQNGFGRLTEFCPFAGCCMQFQDERITIGFLDAKYL